MTIERAEALKKELTDQWVRVESTAPELKRFANSVGQVRTVNMNCRALVEFFGDKDESWYDIAPEFLTITDKPIETPVSSARKSVKTAAVKSAAVKFDPVKSSEEESAGKDSLPQSPLDKIRAGSAVQPAAAPKAASALDEIRSQAATKSIAESIGQPQDSKPLAPMEQIRADSKKKD